MDNFGYYQWIRLYTSCRNLSQICGVIHEYAKGDYVLKENWYGLKACYKGGQLG